MKQKLVNKIFNFRKKLLQIETLIIDTITGQIGGMLKGSLDLFRDVDTIFKCRLPDLGIHLFLSLK